MFVAAAARARGLRQIVDGHHGQRDRRRRRGGAAVVGDGEEDGLVAVEIGARAVEQRRGLLGRDRLADRDRRDAVGEPERAARGQGGDGDADDAAVDVGAREADRQAAVLVAAGAARRRHRGVVQRAERDARAADVAAPVGGGERS